jgi:hypothetical protein
MGGGDGIVGTMTVVWSCDGPAGSSGDTVTDGSGEDVVCTGDVVEVAGVVVVVVCSEPESPLAHAASEPAEIPAASANSAGFDRTLRAVMSPV